MKATMIDELVTARENERVQNKIIEVRQGVFAAIDRMGYGKSNDTPYKPNNPTDYGKSILTCIIERADKWPKEMWEKERAEVSAELLKTMDEMQKALLATSKEPNPNDVIPNE